MASKKSAMTEDIFSALKEYGVPTEESVREISKEVTNEIVGDAADTILEGMDRLFADHSDEVIQRFEALESKVTSIKSELKDEIDGLKADLSNTVSRKQFEDLKSRVDRYHPVR